MEKGSINFWVKLGSFLMVFYVLFSAFGAHALAEKLSVEQMKTFETAMRYWSIHSLALICVNGIFSSMLSLKGFNRGIAGGLLFFCLSLTLHACRSIIGIELNVFALIAPIGGFSFAAAWLILSMKLIQYKNRKN